MLFVSTSSFDVVTFFLGFPICACTFLLGFWTNNSRSRLVHRYRVILYIINICRLINWWQYLFFLFRNYQSVVVFNAPIFIDCHKFFLLMGVWRPMRNTFSHRHSSRRRVAIGSPNAWIVNVIRVFIKVYFNIRTKYCKFTHKWRKWSTLQSFFYQALFRFRCEEWAWWIGTWFRQRASHLDMIKS